MTRRQWLRTSSSAAMLAPTGRAQAAPVDFRFAPADWQTAYCFPDDPHKSLIDRHGRLLYGHPGRRAPEYFPTVVEFSMLGMETDRRVNQSLESPGVPIVRTVIERPQVKMELTTFATRSESDGRVDNVAIALSSRSALLVRIRTRGQLKVEGTKVLLDGRLFLVASVPLRFRDAGNEYHLLSDPVTQALCRFPQQGQSVEVREAQVLLEESRAFWRNWKPFSGEVDWSLPKPYGDFLTACTRNILQAREVRDGKLTFQVGPTCYRGLWVVDGHFILESARYLGYDKDVREGLRTTWTYQRPDGALDAGGGPEHYKDAAIAMFSTVRQCELSQEWSDYDDLLPKMKHAAAFLESRRDKSRRGLIVPGFADGGWSKGYELTNTLWTLAGLKAASARPGGESFGAFYRDLRAGFDAAFPAEMTKHQDGFEYLPMMMKEDPAWQRDAWSRPRPQTAQWALSQAIYPGVVFAPDHPVVRGHVRLMQACTQEDVPIETGWLPHEGLWTYNAAFAAHAYLWAGEREWARRTFLGFLNHATPLYCWREEQPLQGSTIAGYIGDMPHNWASAECVLYLRHMLALEDGLNIRLLDGIGVPETISREPFRLLGSPTRFGRLNLNLEPQGKGWRLEFLRGSGPAPQHVSIPASLAGIPLSRVEGAAAKGGEVEPAARKWTAIWGA